MVRPLVLVVRETPSLADSVQILLETVGFRVVSFGSLASAVERIEDAGAEPIRAIVVACNQAFSDTLRRYPESLPERARLIPFLVVGKRALQERSAWPSNVRTLGLPLDSGALVSALTHLTGIESGDARKPAE
jgi:Flagellar regulatory protein FleQ